MTDRRSVLRTFFDVTNPRKVGHEPLCGHRSRATAARTRRRRRRPRRRRRRKVHGTTSAPDRLLRSALSPLGDGVDPRRTGTAATPPHPRENRRRDSTPAHPSNRSSSGPLGSRKVVMSRGVCSAPWPSGARTSAALRPVDGDVYIDSTRSRKGSRAYPASVTMRLARDARDAPRARRSRCACWLETARDRGDEGDTGATRLPEPMASRRCVRTETRRSNL